MSKDVVLVQSKHIDLGIEKYQGKPDAHLQNLINKARLDYTVYRFNDGRILLVLPHKLSALLYASKEVLFEKLELE